jgi:glycolate oxidase FAD binding subunit
MSTSADVFRDHLPHDAIDTSDLVYRYAAAGVVPPCVLQPTGVDGVAAAVRTAAARGLALIPAGHPTHLDVGHAPRAYDAALSTRGLDRILAHEAADMTVTVESGITVAALAGALAAQQQWLPLDPAHAREMTVGGLVAADRCGPLRFAYGKVRDWLIGLRVVTADGEIIRGGGRVVKNVAGYDLPKLFAGSFGTLGVIVEATFKVRPLPEAEALFVWPAATFERALAQAAAVNVSPVLPVLVEVLNDTAAEALGSGESAALVIGCAGAPAHLDEQERRLSLLSDGAATREPGDRQGALRRALSGFSHAATEDALVARVSALPSLLTTLLPQVEAAARERGVVAEIAVHAGSGVAWCQFLGAVDADGLADLAYWLRRAARMRGAWVVFESLPPDLRARVDPWGYDAPALRLMRGVKRALDPHGVFSPGRFVGGI